MDITFYSTNCPKCKILKAKLDEKGIKYTICSDVDTMLKKGFISAPVLEIDGKVITFLEAINWIKEI